MAETWANRMIWAGIQIGTRLDEVQAEVESRKQINYHLTQE